MGSASFGRFKHITPYYSCACYYLLDSRCNSLHPDCLRGAQPVEAVRRGKAVAHLRTTTAA